MTEERIVKQTWRERIVDARKRGNFNWQDIDDATGSWLTCAVGEQHKLHAQVVVLGMIDEPLDDELYSLGDTFQGFGRAVQNNDIDQAEQLLDKIEDRVLELKREAGGSSSG